MKGSKFTLEAAKAHAAKHHYPLEFVERGIAAQKAVDELVSPTERQKNLPTPVKMTRPEREYGMILEAMKRRGEIFEYRAWGIKLAWGRDPRTGKQMYYTPDFVVFTMRLGLPKGCKWVEPHMAMIEVKGAHIWEKDRIRFNGCRAEWPQFQFEMHQLKAGEWTRIL